ncbi:MAG: hypothetical protein KGL39_19895 [Patescibacteria group bacterium]|nr:hypothetical protein [Patescibacteria group bacterium]
MTAREAIVECLRHHPEGLAIHEFKDIGHSQNAIGTRLPEMARDGIVVGERHPKKQYKVWKLRQ